MRPIYLDFNASTPVAPEVLTAMREHLSSAFGNPSSSHWAGLPAQQAIATARFQVAGFLGCQPNEVVFTSGGTESNNQALKGIAFGSDRQGSHVITTRIEHPSIIETCRYLERQGVAVTYLPVDRTGRVDPDDVRRALRPETALISVMHANNEVGTLHPLEVISPIARQAGVLLHTDAAQSVGKVPVDVDTLGVDLLTLVGHKCYAPKGVGALYVRDGVRLEPLVHGGGQEAGRRAGTESALLATALGAACQLARQREGSDRLRSLRDRFWNGLRERFDDVVLNGHPADRLPNTLNVSFPGQIGNDILNRLDGVAASTGSACHSGQSDMSPVLRAMGVPEEVGLGAIRFSVGHATTEDEIDTVVEMLAELLTTGC